MRKEARCINDVNTINYGMKITFFRKVSFSHFRLNEEKRKIRKKLSNGKSSSCKARYVKINLKKKKLKNVYQRFLTHQNTFILYTLQLPRYIYNSLKFRYVANVGYKLDYQHFNSFRHFFFAR